MVRCLRGRGFQSGSRRGRNRQLRRLFIEEMRFFNSSLSDEESVAVEITGGSSIIIQGVKMQISQFAINCDK